MPDRGRWARLWADIPLRWVGAGLALLLGVAGLAYLTRSSEGHRQPSPVTGAASAVAPASAQASVTPPAPSQPAVDPIAPLTAVETSLTRVVPGAMLESPEMSTVQSADGGSHVRASGLLRNGNRTGALNVIISTSAEPMTCDGFASCDIRPGRCGSSVRRIEFARAVSRGQPRDLEIQVAVHWNGDTLVDVTLDNAVALYHLGGPIPARTGQDPPLSLAQLADFAQEAALNVVPTTTAGACP